VTLADILSDFSRNYLTNFFWKTCLEEQQTIKYYLLHWFSVKWKNQRLDDLRLLKPFCHPDDIEIMSVQHIKQKFNNLSKSSAFFLKVIPAKLLFHGEKIVSSFVFLSFSDIICAYLFFIGRLGIVLQHQLPKGYSHQILEMHLGLMVILCLRRFTSFYFIV